MMKNLKFGIIGLVVMLTALPGGSAFAYRAAPMTPELAAKQEMVRKQREQRITNAQRKTAADVLKEKRRKVYKAKQTVYGGNPGNKQVQQPVPAQ